MKTTEEIKKGLYHCGADDVGCTGCSYNTRNVSCEGNLEIDALTYIVTLENRLAQVEQERDAAEHDLHLLADGEGACNVCARFDEGYIPTPPHCRYACDDDCFRWRGVCEKNEGD